MSGCVVRSRLEHIDTPPRTSQVPYLSGSGDLGVSLFRLMEQIDRLAGERLCPCGGAGPVDSVVRRDVLASLSCVLAACGQVGAVAVVERHAADLSDESPAPHP